MSRGREKRKKRTRIRRGVFVAGRGDTEEEER